MPLGGCHEVTGGGSDKSHIADMTTDPGRVEIPPGVICKAYRGLDSLIFLYYVR